MQQGVSAFLATEHAGSNGATPLLPGALLNVTVVKAKDRRMLQVASSTEASAGSLTKEWPGLSIGELPYMD